MQCLRLALTAVLSAWLLATPIQAQEGVEKCPHSKGWKPTNEQLQTILEAHDQWIEQFGPLGSSRPGRANLCNADLWGTDLRDVNLMFVDMSRAEFHEADLSGATMIGANLSEARLSWANLRNAKLSNANLSKANLSKADLRGASLAGANLSRALLFRADMSGAILANADLSEADLTAVDLRAADLSGTNIQNARFSFVKLDQAVYQPTSAPSKGHLIGLSGLESVWFRPGAHSGLVLLRTALLEAGLRDLEREATFALEHVRTHHALKGWRLGAEALFKSGDDSSETFGEAFAKSRDLVVRNPDSGARIEGALRLVFFEWTTGYGLYPSRALMIVIGLMVVMTVFYSVPVVASRSLATDRHAIIRVWPADRAVKETDGFAPAGAESMERLTAKVPAAFAWAFYFSMLSAFHIGWRDLNVGTWISRIQPNEFALRGRGWVRVASGVQSLISVYLVAMWVLTYFGRPFQ